MLESNPLKSTMLARRLPLIIVWCWRPRGTRDGRVDNIDHDKDSANNSNNNYSRNTNSNNHENMIDITLEDIVRVGAGADAVWDR